MCCVLGSLRLSRLSTLSWGSTSVMDSELVMDFWPQGPEYIKAVAVWCAADQRRRWYQWLAAYRETMYFKDNYTHLSPYFLKQQKWLDHVYLKRTLRTLDIKFIWDCASKLLNSVRHVHWELDRVCTASVRNVKPGLFCMIWILAKVC